jgi:3-deoxy-D-manno-octulosonic-acid transferase
VAFVGGSLVPIGGHNLLEPAAVGVPMLTGPHVFNAEDIAQLLLDDGVAELVADEAALGTAVAALLADPAERARRGALGRDTLGRNRGALGRLLVLLGPVIAAGTTASEELPPGSPPVPPPAASPSASR